MINSCGLMSLLIIWIIYLRWLIRTKHFTESKNTSQNPKHVPESKNTSQNPKKISHNPKQVQESKTHPRIWNLESVFEFWDVFCIPGSVFGFWFWNVMDFSLILPPSPFLQCPHGKYLIMSRPFRARFLDYQFSVFILGSSVLVYPSRR